MKPDIVMLDGAMFKRVLDGVNLQFKDLFHFVMCHAISSLMSFLEAVAQAVSRNL